MTFKIIQYYYLKFKTYYLKFKTYYLIFTIPSFIYNDTNVTNFSNKFINNTNISNFSNTENNEHSHNSLRVYIILIIWLATCVILYTCIESINKINCKYICEYIYIKICNNCYFKIYDCISKRNKIAVVNDNDIHIDDICSICLENLVVNQSNIIATNCKHYYHKKCIIEWLKIKDICPICNTKNISIYDY